MDNIFPQSDTLAESYPKLQGEIKRQDDEDKRLQQEINNTNNRIQANKTDIENKLEQHKNSNDHSADKVRYMGNVPKNNVRDAIDTVDGRISNIVSQAGDDNTEIVDARHSGVKNKAYKSLRERLDGHELDDMPHLIRDDDTKRIYRYGLKQKDGFMRFIYKEV